MVKWCEHFARRLEEKHAGTSTWLQIACDILNSTPATLGARILRWYNVSDLSDEHEMDPKDKGELIGELETRKSTQTVLQVRILTSRWLFKSGMLCQQAVYEASNLERGRGKNSKLQTLSSKLKAPKEP